MTASLPNPFEFNSVESSPADALTVASPPRPDAPGNADATVTSLSGLDPTRAAIVFGCMTSWLRTEVRDINNQIQLRALASNSDVSFSRA
jgi:hypothetical protein